MSRVDSREMLQFNALLEARANASGLDAGSISDDTRQRVALMLRSRRERMMEEEKEYLEELRQSESEVAFSKEIAGTMSEDEKTARHTVLRLEEKAFERLMRTFDDQFRHLSAGMMTLRQQKELESSRTKKLLALQRELNKQRMYLYWNEHEKQRADAVRQGGAGAAAIMGSPTGLKSSTKSHAVDLTSPPAQMHRMTAVLRRAYENSAPLFATDPEELWKRGQALPPTAQSASTTVGGGGGGVDLPPYHEFGAKIREKYHKHVEEKGVGESIGVPVPNPGAMGVSGSSSSSSSKLNSRQKSTATYPYQQDSPFKTSVHEQLGQYLS